MSATAPSLNSIECSDQPLDLSFHPLRETLVAAALVDGTIEVHDFQSVINDKNNETSGNDGDVSDDEDDTILSSIHVHSQLIPNAANDNSSKYAVKKASCRAVKFSNNNGHRLYTGGSAGDLCCLDAAQVCSFSSPGSTNSSVVWRVESATVGSTNNGKRSTHTNPLHVIHQLPACSAKGSLIVSGDDRGGVRLWDERLCDTATISRQTQTPTNSLQLPQGCVLSWKENKDYISALDHSEDGNTLLATSADGCLSVFDIRQASVARAVQNPALARRSDPQDDELLSLVIMKNGNKVVAGTQDGVLAIWSWGTWGDISDRYPLLQNAHSSVDAILKVDENTLLTGSSDGLLRVVTLHPNKVLGALGDHDGFPIESLAFNADRSYVGSISHDPHIRLWDARVLHEDDNEEEEDDKKTEIRRSTGLAAIPPPPPAARGGQASDDEWEDMDEDKEVDDDDMKDEGENKDSDDSGNDSDSDDEQIPSRSENRANKLKSKNEDFFADL